MHLRRSVSACAGGLVLVDVVPRAAYLAPRLLTARGALNYIAAIVALWLVLRLLALWPHPRRVLPFATLVALPMAVQAAVFRAYGQFVGPTDFLLFAASPSVGLSAMRATAGTFAAVMGVVFGASLGCAWLLPAEAQPMRARGGALAIGVLATELALGVAYWRASPTLEHSEPAFACALAGLLRPRTVLARVRTPHTLSRDTTGARPNVVLILGESLAASHLSFYGYPRDTSPRLQKLYDEHALLALRDATVMGPSTRTSLPYILTGLEGPDASGRVFAAPTVLEYAKARGYHTAFISAQEESWGSFDVLFRAGVDVFRTGIAFAPNVDVMCGADDLDVLEQGALPLLARIEEPFFVVLHMNGSHAPYAYHSRASSKVFLPEDGVSSMNAYDNTVRETDEYLARAFGALRARDPGAWMFFTSDHGQPLGEGGAFFNHGYQTNVVRDPLLVFAPEGSEHLSGIADAQLEACDLAPTLLHVIGAKPSSPMDCVDWLADAAPPSARVRVVSAYTPTYTSEPTMLVLRPDGKRELFDLARGTVTAGDETVRHVTEVPLPPDIAARLR